MSNESPGVVITGIGVVAPPGIGTSEFFSGLLSGQCEAAGVESFDASAFACPGACEVKAFNPLDYVKKKKRLKLMGPNIVYAVAAASMAAEQAGLGGDAVAPERLGIVMGARTRISDFDELEKCVLSSLDDDGDFSYHLYATEGMHHVYPLSMLRNLPNMATAHLSILHGALGPTDALTNGAVSGIQALGEAARAIQAGRADVMLAGGTDCLVTPLDMSQLTCLGLLCKGAGAVCRPFDRSSDGAMPGEGAAVFVLEREEHARARGAAVLGRILGFAEGFEPAFTGDVEPSAAAVLSRALAEAGMGADELGGMVLSGTARPEWDDVELAMASAFLGGAPVPLWSSRAHIGLAGAAISALDLAAALQSSVAGLVPPTANLLSPREAAAGLDIVTGESRQVEARPRLVSSYNRAGAVAAMVVSGE